MNHLTHLTDQDLARLSAIELHGKFARVRCVLASWIRGELSEQKLAENLTKFTEKNDTTLRPPVKPTVLGMPALNLLWEEP